MIERKYGYRNVDMLMATKTLISNFKTHKTILTEIRSTWEDPFITEFETEVNLAIKNTLGLESKKNLKLATQEVIKIQADALRDLSFFKVNIKADFRADEVKLKWMLDTFGFTAHMTAARTKDQEALIQLLQKFTNNMNEELKAEIIQKGTSSKLIARIEEYAETLTAANTVQETHKGDSKELTQKAQKELNDIHAKAMSICTIAAKLFKDDPAVKDKFVFSKLVSKLNTYKPGTEPQTEPVPEESSLIIE